MKTAAAFLVVILVALALAACGGGQSAAALRVGGHAPAFSLPSAAGTPVALADYLGRQPVLLYFHMGFG